MIQPRILNFLNDLNHNNNREWFQTHKAEYQEARKAFLAFVEELIAGISSFDPELGTPEAKDAIFRIYRDIRFSNDKRPYKTNMGASIKKGGKKSPYAGYYLHVEPGGSFLAGGMYMPPGDVLKKVRREIHYNPDEFRKIVTDSRFVQYFGELEGGKLKRPPQGYAADDPAIEYLKFKSLTVFRNMDDDALQKSHFMEETITTFRAMAPLIHFLNLAVDEN